MHEVSAGLQFGSRQTGRAAAPDRPTGRIAAPTGHAHRDRMDDLYRDYILEHYRRPHNFGVIDDPTASFEGTNPLCGDRITLMLGIHDGVVDEVGFTGRGCAISQASASLLTDEIKGKPVTDVEAFRADDLLDLLGIEISPARLKCAMLSHETLQKALAERRRGQQLPARHDVSTASAPLQVSPAGLAGTRFHRRPLPSALPRNPRQPVDHRSPTPMPRTYADLLQRPASADPRGDPAARSMRSPRDAAPSSTSARRRSGSRATSRAPSTSARATSSSRSRPPRLTGTPRSILYCAGGVRSLFAAQTLEQLGYTNVASMTGGFQAWKSAGLPWEAPVVLTQEQKQRYSRHLLIPEVGSGRPAAAPRVEGAPDRRRRSRFPGGALSRGRGRRHDRDRRLRRRRPLEPPAPDPPHERSDRRAQGRVGPQDDRGAQPGCEVRGPRGDARRRTTSTGSSPATT